MVSFITVCVTKLQTPLLYIRLHVFAFSMRWSAMWCTNGQHPKVSKELIEMLKLYVCDLFSEMETSEILTYEIKRGTVFVCNLNFGSETSYIWPNNETEFMCVIKKHPFYLKIND